MAQPLLVSPEQDEVRPDGRAVSEPRAALLADAQQGADEVLPVAHPAGDAVDGNPDNLARHGSPLASGSLTERVLVLGKHFPKTRLGREGRSRPD
jgi:hypothetical protein